MSGFAIIEGPYFRDILDQPRALRETVAGLTTDSAFADIADKLRGGAFDRVVLTGMGSSYFALHPLNHVLGQSGHTPVMVETSELIHYQAHLLTSRTLVVAVSQSGRSVEMVRLLESSRKRSTIVAVTNTAESPLATGSDAVVLTHAGIESTVSCKTYVATLVGLHWLASTLTGADLEATRRDLEALPSAFGHYLQGLRTHVESLAGRVKGISDIFMVGRGASLAAVGAGALTTKESTHVHAEGMSSAALRHGPWEMLSGKTFVVLFAGDPRTRELNLGMRRDLEQRGVPCAWVAQDAEEAECRLPNVFAPLLPVVEILPAQMMTLALAANANHEAGKFEHATKVTTVE